MKKWSKMKIKDFQSLKNLRFLVPRNSKGIFRAFMFQRNMNKKAYDRWGDMGMFIFVFILVGVVLWIGSHVFYGYVVDVRVQEAQILSDKLVRAVVENGKLDSDVLEDNFNIFKEARINRGFIGKNKSYFKVEIVENEKIKKRFIQGNRDYEELCGIESSNVRCFSDELIVDNGKYTVKVLTASNNLGKKI